MHLALFFQYSVVVCDRGLLCFTLPLWCFKVQMIVFSSYMCIDIRVAAGLSCTHIKKKKKWVLRLL